MDQVLIKNELMLGMNNATNYSEWLQFASQLDILEGKNAALLTQHFRPTFMATSRHLVRV